MSKAMAIHPLWKRWLCYLWALPFTGAGHAYIVVHYNSKALITFGGVVLALHVLSCIGGGVMRIDNVPFWIERPPTEKDLALLKLHKELRLLEKELGGE